MLGVKQKIIHRKVLRALANAMGSFALLMSCVFVSAEQVRADIINTATAQGTYLGNPVSSAPVTVNVPVAAGTPKIGIVKTASAIIDANFDGKVDAGDQITYSFTVSNLGDVTLNAIAVTEIKVGTVPCVATTLAPSATTTSSAPN